MKDILVILGKKARKIQRYPEALISIMLICLIKVEDLKILKCLKLDFNMEEVFLLILATLF